MIPPASFSYPKLTPSPSTPWILQFLHCMVVKSEGVGGGVQTCPGRSLPHVSVARYFPRRTVKARRIENNIFEPEQRQWQQGRAGGMGGAGVGLLTGEQFGEGRGSREVWLRAKVYLYILEGCGDANLADRRTSFYESHMIYNNSPTGKVTKGAP